MRKQLNKFISRRSFKATSLNNQPNIHPIRLHGPWNATVLVVDAATGSGDLPAIGLQFQCKIPCDWSHWLGNSFRGRVAYHRKFNRPTGLDPNQKVWLVVEEVDHDAKVYLNDRELGETALSEPPFRVEIQDILTAANLVRLEIQKPSDAQSGLRQGLAGGLIGSVRLEIEDLD